MKNFSFTAIAILFSTLISFSQNPFITTWKTDNAGTSCNSCITIPTLSFGYDYDVDWDNDGTYDDIGLTGSVTHDFGSAGTYTIRIQGDFPSIFFDNSGDKSKILSVDQWGDIAWSSMGNAFYGCDNLTSNATDTPDLSSVNNMFYMFSDASVFNADLSGWDVSNVTIMFGVFRNASAFNGDISTWNVSNVTTMANMFTSASVFNGDLSSWDVSSVQSMASMFSNASMFNGNVSPWNVSGVTDMSGMFTGASTFNRDISSWDVSSVTEMQFMFFIADVFNSDVSAWDVSNVTDMSGMFGGASTFNGDLSSWVVSNVTSMQSMFFNANAFNSDLSNWDVSSVTTMQFMFNSAYSFNSDVSAWDVSNVTNMNGTFSTTSAFNSDLSGWDVSNVTDMNSMLASTPLFNSDLSGWDVSNVTTMRNMFSNADAFNSDLSNWDVSNVTSMYAMFNEADIFNSNLNTWDISSVTETSFMFNNTSSFNRDLSNWDVSNVTDMFAMFSNAVAFDQDISSWDVSNVDNMQSMLNGSALSLENYDLLLNAWSQLSLLSNVNLGSAGLDYCFGKEGRDILENNFNWNITGDSWDCPPISNQQMDNCYTIPSIDISAASGNNNKFVHFYDASNNIVCSIHANGSDLGSTSADLYLSNTQRYANHAYMNRDVEINPSIAPANPVTLKFYYLLSELTSLQTADPSVINESILDFTKTDQICNGQFVGPGTFLNQTNSGAYNSAGDIFVETQVASFSNFHAHGQNSVLPIVLESFNVNKKNRTAVLNWKTSSEVSNLGFHIERSLDNINWDRLSFVSSSPSNADGAEYSYIDLSPKSGENYYRIIQEDYDGTLYHSEVRVLFFDSKSLDIFPNPASNFVYINSEALVEYNIYDLKGMRVAQGSTTKKINIQNLLEGTYFFELKTNEGIPERFKICVIR